MKNILKGILWFIIGAVIFGAGFWVGMIDNENNRIVITSACQGSHVQQTFTAVMESRDGVIIRDEQIATSTYSTTCTCYVSDKSHENFVADQIDFSTSDENVLNDSCEDACQAFCNARLAGFTFDAIDKNANGGFIEQ